MWCTGGLEASVRERPTISFLPFKSSHGHPFCDKFSLKTKNVKQCLEAIKKIRDNKIKLRKTDLKNIKFRSYNFASNKPGYKIIVDEFIKLMKLKENKDNNNELFLKLVFKIREFRTKVLNYNYGNRKFSTFDKKETLEIFQILKELNPRFDDLSIDFLKKDIIYIKKNS